MTSSAGGHVNDARHAADHVRHRRASTTSRERELPHLRGWRGSAPVRIGNGAWDQTQLDVYGELLIALDHYREQLGELHPEIQRFAATWPTPPRAAGREADAGMWEMRGEPRHHLSSKVLCWAALDRAVKLAPQLGEYADAEQLGGGARRDPRGRSSSAAGARAAGLCPVLRLATSSTPRRC